MPKREKVALRRQHVYKLAMLEGRPIAETANIMKQTIQTIKNDLTYLRKQTRQTIEAQDHESFLTGLMGNTLATRERVMGYLQKPDIADTARAKYESLLMQCDSELERRFTTLAGLRPMQATTLEDRLANMSFDDFQRLVGYPVLPLDKMPRAITAAQMKVWQAVSRTARSLVALNKSRQCGFTEIVLRIMAYLAFSKYRGKKIGIVTGTRIETTEDIFSRLCDIFAPINETVFEKKRDTLILKNGTSFHVIPASKHAINGWTNIGAFMLDESSKWNLEDDQVVLNSFKPLADTNGADLFMLSTPNGPRGFFYHILNAPSPQWTKLTIDVHEAGKELYTPEHIARLLAATDLDPAQEYLCKFVGGRDSIFGDLTDDDLSTIYQEARTFD